MSIGFLASIKAAVGTLTGRLTSTRAGYLDNLQHYTSTRAGYVDLLNTYLNATITSRQAAIKTIRHGTVSVSISSSTSGTGTDTFTAVDTSKTLLFNLGASGSYGNGNVNSLIHRIALTNTTTVTASVQLSDAGTYTITVGYLLVEFN